MTENILRKMQDKKIKIYKYKIEDLKSRKQKKQEMTK